MSAKLILSVIFILCLSTIGISAPPPPSGGPGCWPPPCVPIDGGLSLLIAAGVLYGGKTFFDKRKENKSIL